MSATRLVASGADRAVATPTSSSVTRRAGLTALTLAALAGAAVVVYEARTGVGARRIRNDTSTAHTRTYPSFLGTNHWPQIFEVVSLVLTAGFWGAAVVRSRRRASMTPTLLMLIVTTLMTALDPIMNWAPYASYDPRLLHFPETWGWASIAPTVEPLVVFVGYSYFFVIPAYVTLALVRRLEARRPSGSFVRRHAFITTLAVSLPVCVVWDGLAESVMTRMGIYSYTQVIGSLSIRAGSADQFPLYEALLFGAVLSLAAPLMRTDDRGHTWAERVAGRTAFGRRHRQAGAVAIAFGLMGGVYLGYGATFAVVRLTHSADTAGRPWPFPSTKVYDPNGAYQRSGEPGPYFPGIWSAGSR